MPDNPFQSPQSLEEFPPPRRRGDRLSFRTESVAIFLVISLWIVIGFPFISNGDQAHLQFHRIIVFGPAIGPLLVWIFRGIAKLKGNSANA